MEHIAFRLFGQQCALNPLGQPLYLPASIWPLLGHLLSAPGYRMSRQALAGALWPEHDEKLARHSLASALWRLGHKAGPTGAWLSASKSAVALCPVFAGTIDVVAFDTVASAVLRDPAALNEPAGRMKLREALDRYTGDFLPEVSDIQIQIERERLRALFLDAGLEYVRACRRHTDWQPACEVARAICAAEPFREDAQRLLMESLVACGNEAMALYSYRAFERLLDEELGVKPARETLAIADAIESRHRGAPPIPAIPRARATPMPRSQLLQARRQIGDGLELLDRILAQAPPGEQPIA